MMQERVNVRNQDQHGVPLWIFSLFISSMPNVHHADPILSTSRLVRPSRAKVTRHRFLGELSRSQYRDWT